MIIEAISGYSASRLLKNVGEADKTRQKQARKRTGLAHEFTSGKGALLVSLALRVALKRVSRKRLAEPVFNAALSTQVVFHQPGSDGAG
jgi:hypothetical protein